LLSKYFIKIVTIKLFKLEYNGNTNNKYSLRPTLNLPADTVFSGEGSEVYLYKIVS